MSVNHTVCWVDIPVSDLDRAIGFYSAVLAAKVSKEQMGPEQAFGLLPHTEDNVAGCLCVMEDTQPSEKGPLVYLKVEGRLDDAVAKVRAGGGRVIQDKHAIGPYGHRAVVVDSEGNRIALHSQVA